jgi:hypothetical protein
MPFTKENQKIQALSADGANQPFAQCVRFRSPGRDLHDDQPHTPDLFIEFFCVDGISVMNEKPVFMVTPKCFPELLCPPGGRRVIRNIEVDYALARMLHHDQHIEHFQ